MRDEIVPSFEWVFRTFSRCLNNKPPICILTGVCILCPYGWSFRTIVWECRPLGSVFFTTNLITHSLCLSDQCSSILSAMEQLLKGIMHKLCHWHIMKKNKDHLALLYKANDKLKDELTFVLKHPLMPSEFDSAWNDPMQKYNLQNDMVIIGLWDDRRDWISAYYKDIFCARMTSTQRSKSMNCILKNNFVKERHDLQLFAEQVDKCIQTRRGVEHTETIANEVMSPRLVLATMEDISLVSWCKLTSLSHS